MIGQPNMPPAGVSGGPGGIEPPAQGAGTSNNYRIPYGQGSGGSAYRQPQLQAPVPAQPVVPARKPATLRFDRITSTQRPNAEGQVVRADRQPEAGMKVIFVCADAQGGRQSLTTDGAGRFQTTLTAGNWLVYTQDAGGKLMYQQKVRVAADAPTAPITLVSR